MIPLNTTLMNFFTTIKGKGLRLIPTYNIASTHTPHKKYGITLKILLNPKGKRAWHWRLLYIEERNRAIDSQRVLKIIF